MSVILLFLEFLATSSLSYRVILKYMSALKYMFARYGWLSSVLEAPKVRRMLDRIKLSTRQAPSPKMVFSSQICEISRWCDYFPDPMVYQAAFLLAFYAFLCISNIACCFQNAFDPTRHLKWAIIYKLLRNDTLSSCHRSMTHLCAQCTHSSPLSALLLPFQPHLCWFPSKTFLHRHC